MHACTQLYVLATKTHHFQCVKTWNLADSNAHIYTCFCKQQHIICATEGSNLMQNWLHGEKNHPIHAVYMFFLHFPTHTQIKLMVHTKDFMLMFSWLNKIGSRKTKTKKHEFLPLCRASSGCLPTWCLTKCGATPCFSILAWPPTGYFSHGDRVTKITWHGSLSAGGRGSEE